MVKTAAKEASCMEDGNIEYWICSKCHKLFSDTEGQNEITEADTVIGATGHIEEILASVEPTCTETGLTEGKKCSVCGEILVAQEEVAALGHDYVARVVEPTCTVGGFTTYTCSRCGDSYTADETQPKGHSFGEWIIDKDSSCTEDGIKHRTCSACDFTETEGINKKDHNFSTEFTVDKEPTCTEDGSQSYHCMNDGCTVITGSEVIPALGHNYVEMVTPAIFSQNGSIDEKCDRCGDEQHVKDIVRLKTVKLSATAYVYNGKAKKPTVKVTDAEGTVVTSDHYSAQYATGRTKVGKYNVKVTFKNNYSGTKTLTFKINPKGTTLLKPTPAAKAITVKWKKQAVQTSGYQIMIATNSKFTTGKKTVTITKTGTTSKKITNLKAKKKYYIKIRTYKTVNGTKNWSGWSTYKTATTK